MVNFIRRIFDFYIFSNIHVALAAFSLTKITLLSYKIEDNLVPFFVLLATLASYNFIRLYKIDTIQNWFYYFLKKNRKSILALTFISGFLLFYFSFLLSFKALLTLIPFAILTLFYVVPFPIGKGNRITLRNLSFIKLFLITISWAGVTVLVPLIHYNIAINKEMFFIFIQRFLFLMVVVIPFDIRDISFDDKTLKTLPQTVGIRQVKIIGIFFLMVFLALEVLKNSIMTNQFRLHLSIALLSLFFLFRAKKNQNKYYSAFFVESIPIVWLLLFVWWN